MIEEYERLIVWITGHLEAIRLFSKDGLEWTKGITEEIHEFRRRQVIKSKEGGFYWGEYIPSQIQDENT